MPLLTRFSLPSGAIELSKMLQPTQPARFAVGPIGLRFSTAEGAKKNDGTSSSRLTCQAAEYCMTSKFGEVPLLTAAIILP